MRKEKKNERCLYSEMTDIFDSRHLSIEKQIENEWSETQSITLSQSSNVKIHWISIG